VLTSFAIDWIRATTKHHSIRQVIERFSFGFEFDDWATFKALNGYDSGIQNPYGHSIMWHSQYEDMGVNVLFDGRSCNGLHDAGFDLFELVLWLSEEEFKFTRLDLAIDIRGVEINILDLFECEHQGSINNDPELYMKGRKARGGATIYLGSRWSEKFLRIYDKAKERKLTDQFWTRVELELKGNTATKIAKRMRTMSYDEIALMTHQIVKGMYDPESEVFQKAFAVKPIKIGSTKNEKHNTREWLMTTIAKTFAKTMLELPHVDLMAEFEREVHTQLELMKIKQDYRKENIP
jgi:DNA relaxase NicK